MKLSFAILVLACLTLCHAQSTCNVKITIGQRQGASWDIGSTHYQIYDIVVKNEGTCPLTSLIGLFTPTTGLTSETWNYDAPSGQIRGYGAIAAGQSFFDAGFVLANSTSAPTLTRTQPSCLATCYTATTMAPTNAPSTSAPSTSAPSTAAPSTSAPSTSAPSTSAPSTSAPSTSAPSTSAPSTSAPSTNAPSSCYAMITASARQGSTWNVGATHYQIYDLVVVNRGTCPLTKITAKFTTGAGAISEAWNYDAQSGMIMFGSALAVGQSYNNAGMVLAGSAQLALGQTSFSCPESCSPTAPTGSPSTSAPSTATPSTATPSTATPSTATPSTATPSTAAPSTAAPSTAAPSTAAPSTAAPSTAAPSTAAPSTAAPSTSAPGRCAVTAVLTRDSYSWLDAQGRSTSVYHLTVTNAGPCALKHYAVSFASQPGSMLSYWNLEATTGGYLVKGYGDTLAAGASDSSAGIILAGAPNSVAVILFSSTCTC